jgi:potassium-transporting ATPase KdpC subunit
MKEHLRPALTLLVAFTAVTGLAYPALVTGIAQLVMPAKSDGSMIVKDGKAVGSALIGQPFSDPKHFWSRASGTSPYPYNAASSSGTNQGPTNPALVEAVSGRIKALKDADPGNKLPIPVDLVTASGSGLDPHISPAAAEYQVARVARARNLAPAKVRELVARHTEGRQLGILGEARVNVLELNLELETLR